MIEILEHSSKSYAPRTWANAANSDVTIALAVDYTTAGERLTHKAAVGKYLQLPLKDEWTTNARKLYRHMHRTDIRTINVAGNGIYTLDKHGWSQSDINEYIYLILEMIEKWIGNTKIISGGQTGADIAGAWAGHKLGIPVCVTLPKGLIQRHEDGVDREHTYEEIMKQIVGD